MITHAVGARIAIFHPGKQSVELGVKIPSAPRAQRQAHTKANDAIDLGLTAIRQNASDIFFRIIDEGKNRTKPDDRRDARACSRLRASTRSFVVLTFGSIFLHRSSSQVVSVICTTHFVFRLMACKRSRSRNTRSDLVIIIPASSTLSMPAPASRHDPLRVPSNTALAATYKKRPLFQKRKQRPVMHGYGTLTCRRRAPFQWRT